MTIHACMCVYVLTGKLEVGLGGVYRCHDGGSSQSGRQRNSYSLQYQAGTHIYSLLGTAVTSHTHRPADLDGRHVKGYSWYYSTFLLLSTNPIKRPKPIL